MEQKNKNAIGKEEKRAPSNGKDADKENMRPNEELKTETKKEFKEIIGDKKRTCYSYFQGDSLATFFKQSSKRFKAELDNMEPNFD